MSHNWFESICILPTTATATASFIGKINIKINKGGISSEIVSVLYLYMFCKLSATSSLSACSHFCCFCVSMVRKRLAQEGAFGAGRHSKRHWGPRARQVLGMKIQNQQLDRVPLCSFSFSHKTTNIVRYCLWKLPHQIICKQLIYHCNFICFQITVEASLVYPNTNTSKV